MTSSGGIHFIYRLKREQRVLLSFSLMILTLVCLVINSIHNVYGIETPKRLYIQSTTRNWDNGSKDAGLWINPHDSLAMEPLRHIGIEEFDEAEYHKFGDLDQPWFLPVADMFANSFYIHVDYDEVMDTIPNEYKTNIQIINQSSENNEVLTYFQISGPSHFTINIDTSNVIDWSFEIPVFYSKKHGDKIVFIFMANGLEKMIRTPDEKYEDLQIISDERPVRSESLFWLKTKGNADGEKIEFTFNGHHINGEYARNKNRQTELAQRIIDKMPEWVDPIWLISELIEVKF